MVRLLKAALPLLMLFCLALLLWSLDSYSYFNLETLRDKYDVFSQYIHQNKLSSILLFSGIYIGVVALSLPFATFLTLTAGLLFDQILGTCMVVVSATLGATVVFLSAKWAANGILVKTDKSWIQSMQKGFQDNAFWYLMSLRLLPVFPFVLINLAAAFFLIPLRIFFFGTLFGIVPGSFIYVSFGVALKEVIHLENFESTFVLQPKILVALFGLALLSLVPVIIKLARKRRHQ